MKKLIALMAVALSCFGANAQTTIQIVWPFSVSSSDAQMVHAIVDSANRQQNKYKFVFYSKQGAGGTIAASYVLENPDTVLFGSSSFYVRPNLYKESHDPERFSNVASVCYGKPLVVLSRKYANIKELSGKTFSVGMNNGSITQLVSRTLKANTDATVIEVPYKGTPETTMDMLGGHLDAGIDHAGASLFAKLPTNVKVYVLGITGTVSYPNLPTFKSQGLKGFDNLTNNYNLFVSSSTSTARKQELNQIFNQALDSEALRESCESDFAKISKSTLEQADRAHQQSIAHWRKVTQGMPKE